MPKSAAVIGLISAAVGAVGSIASGLMGGKGGGGKGDGGGGTVVQQQGPQTDPAAEAARRRASGTDSDLTGGLDLGNPEIKKPKLGSDQDTKQAGAAAGGGLLG